MLTKLRNAGFDSNWRELGQNLGLRPGTLNVIEQNYPKSADRCLDECVTKWLQRADDVDTKGMPTYDVLADALVASNQKAAADSIRKYIIHI